MDKQKLKNLPQAPGCYIMKDDQDQVIYVGKAKNLANRVKSYFTGAHNEKTTRLISEIVDFTTIITHSEQESLILELNLIKQYLPKYNIRLVDDKTYPYIELTEEEHPRLQVVRKKTPKGRIFGPYPNVYSARETARLLNRLYPLRKCDPIPKVACLYYHIGQCLGPCINKEKIDYEPHIEAIIRFLKGDTKEVSNTLKKEMKAASEALSFEKAAEYRDMIQHIENTTEKQFIDLNDLKDRDAIGIATNNEDVAIQILKMRQGKIVDHEQTVFAFVQDPIETVLTYLSQYYEHHQPDELLLDHSFTEVDLNFFFGSKAIIPQKGSKKKLVDLAVKNAKHDLTHHHMLYRHQQERRNEALQELKDVFKREINKIEVFDNAQLFGTSPISAMIVFKNDGFAKKDYRKYHLKSTTNDDYQAIREVTYRRYQKLFLEKKELPDLILVDGGVGHTNAAKEVIDSLNLKIPVAGLKKNNKHQLESLYYDDKDIALLKQTNTYKFLLKLSEEVHRFAIDFHRKTRTKAANQSPFDDIVGLGEKRKRALLQHFKSLDEIKDAEIEVFVKIGIPRKIAEKIKEVLDAKSHL